MRELIYVGSIRISGDAHGCLFTYLWTVRGVQGSAVLLAYVTTGTCRSNAVRSSAARRRRQFASSNERLGSDEASQFRRNISTRAISMHD
jgi:hypothetical protein